MNKFFTFITFQFLFVNNLCEIIFNFFRDKTKIKSSKNDIDIFTSLSENFLQTEIKLGNPIQTIPVRISSEYYSLNIINKNATDKLKSFDPNISSSYINISLEIDEYTEFFKKVYLSKDDFSFNNNKNVKNFTFVLGTLNEKDYSGVIGLRLISTYKDKSNIIENLKEINEIKNKAFQLKYTNLNNESGILIIGNNTYNHSENNFIKENIPKIKLELTWGFNILKIKSGKDEVSKNEIMAKINFDYGLILGSNSYNKSIYDKFFKENIEKKICYPINFNNLIHYICNKNVNLKNFPPLILYSKDSNLEFSLNYEDLFTEINGKYYFLVNFEYIHKSEIKEFWNLGVPFIKKYSLIFDRDKNIVGLYKERINNEPEKSNFLTLSLILSCLIIIGLLLYICYYVLRSEKRMKRAQELYDDVGNNDEKLI